MTDHFAAPDALSGRIQANPSALLHSEILAPQFDYELRHLLRWYLLIEQVLLREYERMELLSGTTVDAIHALLQEITPDRLTADPQANMSDIAFAIERYVEQHQPPAAAKWHVDRSRNDYQACAQLMFGRDQLLLLTQDMLACARAVHDCAQRHATLVMPGYTHFQAAQIISPGFHLAALCEHIIGSLEQLAVVYTSIDACPLGAGALAGQYLPWDRARMAELLGFQRPQPHALVAVASREWSLRIGSELAIFSGTLSRFITDLLLWGSSEYGFIDLPDQLAGISSAMPQKKNFPVLERIRGKTAHVAAYYLDFLLGQRNTPYTNLVEVSKESTRNLLPLFDTMRSVLSLLSTVIGQLEFRPERMKRACDEAYLGGFTLANLLTLHADIPYRSAQVIAGRFILQVQARQPGPEQIDLPLLEQVCREQGYPRSLAARADIFADVWHAEHELYSKQALGSTNPAEVGRLLTHQAATIERLQRLWDERRRHTERAYQALDAGRDRYGRDRS